MQVNFDPDKVPQTIEEAVEVFLAGVDDELRVAISEGNYPPMFHHSIGRGIRNTWSLWADTPLRRDAISRYRIAHGDDLWGLLISWVTARLRNEEFDPVEHCNKYHIHWAKSQTDSLQQAGLGPDGEPLEK